MTDGLCPFATQVYGVTSFQRGPITPVGFCDHTAGGFLSTMRAATFWNGAGVSTHFAIGRKGEIIQLVNIFDIAFAQGRLGPVVTWPPYNEMGQANPNTYLISTEHEDAETVNGQTRFISQWTEAQYAADLRVKRWCVDEVRRVRGADCLRFQLDSLSGHYQFDGVNRAECPGRYWRNEYRQRLYNDLTKEAPPVDPEKRRLYAAVCATLLEDYDVVSAGINPAHGKEVVQVVNKDGSPCNPEIWIAIRS